MAFGVLNKRYQPADATIGKAYDGDPDDGDGDPDDDATDAEIRAANGGGVTGTPMSKGFRVFTAGQSHKERNMAETAVEMIPIRDTELDAFLTQVIEKAVAGAIAPIRDEISDIKKSLSLTGDDLSKGVRDIGQVSTTDKAVAGKIISRAMEHNDLMMEKGIDIFSIHQKAARGKLPTEAKLRQIKEIVDLA